MYAVELENVSFSYYNEKILNNLNLQIPENEFSVIIGANGGGKSTLLKLILGLLKPDNGTVKVLGKNVGVSYEGIGYVPQDSTHMRNFPITVIDVVMMGFYNKKLNKTEMFDKTCEFLEKLQILQYLNKHVKELSTGQRQRVFLARALVSDPKLILLDEPVSGVDPTGQGLIMELLASYREKATILFVSHDLDIIPNYATSVICVNRDVYYHRGNEIPEGLYRQGYMSSFSLVKHECKCAD